MNIGVQQERQLMEYKEWLDELLARTDIVKVISAYTPLTKKGNTYWGCCPFHHEKTPSFTVNGDRGLYHCFGCKAGGNAITFIKAIESVETGEAMRILAKSVNMEPPPSRQGSKEDDVLKEKKRVRLFALMRDAARRYHENLSLPQAKKATDYLAARQVDARMVTRFGLGYALDGKQMLSYLEKKGYTQAEMRDAGIAAQRADDWYDVFYGRLIIPIINAYGEVIAFGGRTLEKDPDFAKYRNSSQTLIFDKSRVLYAVNLLKKRKQSAPLPYVIMAEGYMDVIALHRAGFDTAVASMGTALTLHQAKLIKNYCPNIYISYDGDTAGQKATLRGLDILADVGLHVKVVSLPTGLDPDDVIKKNGAAAYQKLLDEALSLPAFKLKVLHAQFDLSVPEEKSQYAVEAIKVIKALKNPVEQEEYLKIVHTDTGYSMDVLLKQSDLTAQPEPLFSDPEPIPPPQPTEGNGIQKYGKAETFVLASLINNRDFFNVNDDLFPILSDDFARQVCSFCLQNGKSDRSDRLSSLYSEVDDVDIMRLEALVHYEFMPGDGKEKYAACVRELRIAALVKQQDECNASYNKDKKSEDLMRLQTLTRQINRLRNGADDE